MGERHAAKAAAGLWCTAVAVALIGCAPDPTPTPLPTATGFASEAEAFAAAEATYRAYVDAVNARRADQRAPDPVSYLSGAARKSSLEARRRFSAEGIRLVGKTSVTDVIGLTSTHDEATIQVCVDSSGTRLLDSRGVDITPAERSPSGSLEIDLAWRADRFFIVDSRESSASC
ncbi:hypothetical protein [Microbacterium sp. T2.11-28]|uniref:hypothetical protein n=1 Tax=Microbacterium sp. T2.11-28 TaxID=3041169 RepID=UPI00254103D6|nr:hypothetical protein [Microbacterium sp. T2.11-28]